MRNPKRELSEHLGQNYPDVSFKGFLDEVGTPTAVSGEGPLIKDSQVPNQNLKTDSTKILFLWPILY